MSSATSRGQKVVRRKRGKLRGSKSGRRATSAPFSHGKAQASVSEQKVYNSDEWPFLHLDLCMQHGRAPTILKKRLQGNGADSHLKTSAICGPLRLQVVSSRDLSKPTLGRLDLSSSSGATTRSSLSDRKHSRLLHLQLTDGYCEISCIEIAHVAAFDSEKALLPGNKIELVGNITIRKGFALLGPQNVKVLGGHVPHLVQNNNLSVLHDPFQGFHSGKVGSDQPPPFEEYDAEAEKAAILEEERVMHKARVEAAKREAALRGDDPKKVLSNEDSSKSKSKSFAQRHHERKQEEARMEKKGIFDVKECKPLFGQHKRNTMEPKKKLSDLRNLQLRGILTKIELMQEDSALVPHLEFAIKDSNDFDVEVCLSASSSFFSILLGIANVKGAPTLEKLWSSSKGKKFVSKRTQKLSAALITGAPMIFRVEQKSTSLIENSALVVKHSERGKGRGHKPEDRTTSCSFWEIVNLEG